MNKKNYYFLGIGGIGMSAIARYLNFKGHNVSGYDRVSSALTKQLEAEGIAINYEDIAQNVPSDTDLVIYTPAIPHDSKQMQEVNRLGLRMIKRSVALGHITENKKVLAVAGSHGKTTTCGMIAHILSSCEVECSAFLGGLLNSLNTNFIYSNKSDYVVVEADEYDRSFLQLKPFVSVITAIDEDHMDIYHTYENLHQAFEQYAMLTDKQGKLIVKNTRPEILDLMQGKTNLASYSLQGDAMCYAKNIKVEDGKYFFDYQCEGFEFKEIMMLYPGRHNIENAVAAITVCDYVMQQEGYSFAEREKMIKHGIETFEGMKRRLTYMLKTPQRIFIDDYAHHPQEISATINSLREMYPSKKLTGIFQPHLYTRTRDLAQQFASSLDMLDEVILLPIYPAREEPIEGVNSQMILEKMTIKDKYCVSKQELYPLIQKLNPQMLITFGAGDIDRELNQIKQTLIQL